MDDTNHDLPLDQDEANFREEVTKAKTRIESARTELEAAYADGRSLVERANKMAADTADLLGPLVAEVQKPLPEAPTELTELAQADDAAAATETSEG